MILPLRLTRKMREKLQTVEPYVGEMLVLTGGLMYAEAIAHDDENAKIWMSDNIDTMFVEELLRKSKTMRSISFVKDSKMVLR